MQFAFGTLSHLYIAFVGYRWLRYQVFLREDGSDEPSEHMCFASGNIRARWHGMQQAPDVVSRPELEQECARYM